MLKTRFYVTEVARNIIREYDEKALDGIINVWSVSTAKWG
jgi:hypothetical protein